MKGKLGWITALGVAAAIGWAGASVTNSVAIGKEPRFPQLTLDGLDAQQRPLGDYIMKISSVGIAGPYNLLLRSPGAAKPMLALLDYLRFNTSVPKRLNEFAILIQGRLWRSQVEWYAHYPLAIKAGVSATVLADLKAKKRPDGMQPDEAAVYDFVMEISTKHEVSDDTFARISKVLNQKQIVDLMLLSGTYMTAAVLLNTAEEGVPAGKELPFKPGEP